MHVKVNKEAETFSKRVLVSKFIFANKNKKEILEWTKVKNTIRFWLKNTTLAYNYCQCRQSFKSQTIKSKSYIAGIT